ncbi:MAG: hypothetical protein HOL85_12335 [Rhodospirillaceae bacterium]|nr:hypothetical protein [Rhodospirillaceae bacterium]MBT6139961.1 hypothetical protein [Rhodospirillaceae bacterium]
MAQQSGAAASGTADKAAPPAAKQQLLTPEQIEELQGMVGRLQTAMGDLVQAARNNASQIAQNSNQLVLTTNQVAAIAIGAAAGAVIFDFLGGGGLATMTGAVIGGVAGHWMTTAQLDPPAAES